MGIESAKWVNSCDYCGRDGLMDIDLIDRDSVPPYMLDEERDKDGDLFCPSCRKKIISITRAQTDKKYEYYGFDFKSRKERLEARDKRIEEADPTSYRITKARKSMHRHTGRP